MSQTQQVNNRINGLEIANPNDVQEEASIVNVQTVHKIPSDKVLSNMTVTTTSGRITPANTQFEQDTYITGVTILPLTPSNVLTVWVQLGGLRLGSSASPIIMSNAIYQRNFQEPHLPLVHAGDTISVIGSDNGGQSITVLIEGYKVQSYG